MIRFLPFCLVDFNINKNSKAHYSWFLFLIAVLTVPLKDGLSAKVIFLDSKLMAPGYRANIYLNIS